MFAIIETGGKQYKVSAGSKLKVEKLNTQGGAVHFDKVLLVANGADVKVGTPYISGTTVSAKVLGQGRHDKRIIFKYHSKTRQRKMKGHRQPFTEIEVTSI